MCTAAWRTLRDIDRSFYARSLKWKPPTENSIDFKLLLRFPPSQDNRSQPDYFAKPMFELHTWCGGPNYQFWDVLAVQDDEWERLVKMLAFQLRLLNRALRTV